MHLGVVPVCIETYKNVLGVPDEPLLPAESLSEFIEIAAVCEVLVERTEEVPVLKITPQLLRIELADVLLAAASAGTAVSGYERTSGRAEIPEIAGSELVVEHTHGSFSEG